MMPTLYFFMENPALMASCWIADVKGKERRRNLYYNDESSRIEPLSLVGTARCAVRAAFSGATMPPAASRAGTSQSDLPTEVRFRGKEGSFWNLRPLGTRRRL